MKRPSKDNEKSTNKETKREKSRYTLFLEDLSYMINNGIHSDLARSEKFLDKYELDDYIKEDGSLNVKAIENNEDLTVDNVVSIAINWARHDTHVCFHEAIDNAVENAGLSTDEFKFDCGHDRTDSHDEEPGIIVTSDINDLPDDVKASLKRLLNNL